MHHGKLTTTIEEVWKNEIKNAYLKGIICSERHLQAEMYLHLKQASPQYQVWVEPTFELGTGRDKWKIKPDLIVTKGNEIQCIIELKYVPYKEVHFKADIEKMYWLEKHDRGKKFNLKTQPSTGNYSDEVFYLSEELLCVYAAIALGDFAWGVKNRKFWKENNYEIKIPDNFLHLVGRVYGRKGDTRKPEFVNADMD